MAELSRPVSAELEAELAAQVRRHGIVAFCDKEGRYAGLVDRLQQRAADGGLGYAVVRYAGSYLEVLLALEGLTDGLETTPLLLYLPGHARKDAAEGTPLLETVAMASEHTRTLETLIERAAAGKVEPERVAEVVRRPDLTLDEADAWLAAELGGHRAGIEAGLEQESPEVVAREMLIEHTLLGRKLAELEPDEVDMAETHLRRRFGMMESWLAWAKGRSEETNPGEQVAEIVAAWVLCVEYVDDLRRAPLLEALQPLKGVPKPIVESCRRLAQQLRDQHPDDYTRISDHVQDLIGQELEQIRPEDLGRIDTFRLEEARILEAAIRAMEQGDWVAAWELSEVRREERSFWLQRDPLRQQVWELVAAASHLGVVLREHPRPLAKAESLAEAIKGYTDQAWQVDHAQRCFEAVIHSHLALHLPHFGNLKSLTLGLRRAYRAWADRMAEDLSTLYADLGVLPDASLQQRTLFDQVIRPLVHQGHRVAVLLVDALRYEMATELALELQGPGVRVRLSARLAELPTITAIGMNALAPVARGGRLHLAGNGPRALTTGLRAGELTVNDPASRALSMGQRAVDGPAASLELAALLGTSPEALRHELAAHRLVVVHCRELDNAGEAGAGPVALGTALGRIGSACRQLRAAGIDRLVICADHGFLLLDADRRPRAFGTKKVPSRRHVLVDEPRSEPGLLRISLDELGYDGHRGFLLMPRDTTLFDAQGHSAGFVHGGCSLQERVIPVLVVETTNAPTADLGAYRVQAEALDDPADRHRLRLRLLHDPTRSKALPYTQDREVDLVLVVEGRPDVEVQIVGAGGPGRAANNRLKVPVGERWTEVRLSLLGPIEERVRLRVEAPAGGENVEPCRLAQWLDVRARAGAPSTPAAASHSTSPAASSWLDELPDDGTRKVLAHLARHGSITEQEAQGMLGGARAMRRFSNRLEELLQQTPLEVEIRPEPDGTKRYVCTRGGR